MGSSRRRSSAPIEWRWGLAPLTVRDASAGNLADALDLTAANPAAPAYPVPPGPFGVACPDQASTSEWSALQRTAAAGGWPSGG